MKHKRILSMVLVCAMCFASIPLNAFISFSTTPTANAVELTDGFEYYVIDGKACITGCKKISSSIVIPSRIDGYSVTSIGTRAFFKETVVTNITLPDSLTLIGAEAFHGCTSLKNITLPRSLTTIYSLAFWDCTSLESITIPNSVTKICDSTFYGCINLTDVKLPKNLTSIDDFAFYGCTSLESITIPDSVTSIGGSAFYKTPWLTSMQAKNPLVIVNNILIDGKTSSGDIVIPNSVTSIADNSFYECTGLESITIPNSVISIGDYAFRKCNGLESILIPDSVTNIGKYIFSYCSNLTNVTISKNLTSISDGAFCGCTSLEYIKISDSYGCTSVEYITIPESVTSIGENAFRGCAGITGITIPDSVTSIGDTAFYDCYNLKINGWSGSYGEAYANEQAIQFIPLVVGPSTGLKYEIKDGVICINDYDVHIASEVVIPSEIKGLPVTSIGENAFLSCTHLNSITIPDSVKYIGDHAFNLCTNLNSITIPHSVTIIGDFAFNNCKSLKSITILNSDCDIPSMEYTISNGFDAETGTVYYNGTIRGYDNSTAQTYALKHNYDFKSLGKAPTDGSTTATDQIIGDVNGDGNFNISDVVIFQKWILAVPNTKLINWKMADFCEDDRLDVFDLCLMKRTLFEGQ